MPKRKTSITSCVPWVRNATVTLPQSYGRVTAMRRQSLRQRYQLHSPSQFSIRRPGQDHDHDPFFTRNNRHLVPSYLGASPGGEGLFIYHYLGRPKAHPLCLQQMHE
jgi:hypothetical protein